MLPLPTIAGCWVLDKIASRRQQSREQWVTNWLQGQRIRPAAWSSASSLAIYGYRAPVAIETGEELTLAPPQG